MAKMKHLDYISNQILTMSPVDITLVNIVQERVVNRLDKMAKLTSEEENLVQVATMMFFIELKKVQK